MKGALAAMVGALTAIKKAGISIEGRAYFAGVIDEKRNYRGADYIAKNGPKTRYAIVGEPTELEIHNGHRGLIWIEVKIHGKYAHGGTPEKGINAIEKANSVITEIVTKLKPEIMKRNHTVTGPANLNLFFQAARFLKNISQQSPQQAGPRQPGPVGNTLFKQHLLNFFPL